MRSGNRSDAPLGHDDRLEVAVPHHGLDRLKSVQVMAFGVPAAFLVDEQGGGIALRFVITVVAETLGREANADQSEEAPALAISRPNDLVLPVGVFPAKAFDRIRPGQRGEKTRFEIFALPPELVAGKTGVACLEHRPHRPAEHKPGGKAANRQQTSPE